MNNMNMTGMNPGGGPVGGMPGMHNAPNAVRPRSPDTERMIEGLPTYIYDYLLKNEYYEAARALLKSGAKIQRAVKPSPGQSNNENNAVNGVDGNAMDTDQKDDAKSNMPDDLPLPSVPLTLNSSFLYDWWALFSEVFFAQRGRNNNPDVQAFVQQSQVSHTFRHRVSSIADCILQAAQRSRQDQQQAMLRGMNPPMHMNPQQYQHMLRLQQANGISDPNGLQRKAMQNRMT